VRVADPTNTTLFLILPYQWAEFDLRGARRKKPPTIGSELASRTGKEILEVASTDLAFGYTLQVGKSTEDRERILKGFRRIFVAALIPLVLLGFVGWNISLAQGPESRSPAHGNGAIHQRRENGCPGSDASEQG
jgi:hypothetical protein